MESKIQPILCCVGAAVAGRPTQFLMEKAFDAAHCDWRVITVEVQPENFQTALEGMRAMAFTAIRFFPELQLLAASLMSENPRSSLSTAVTSAMRKEINATQDRWDYWDNQGFGMLDLIEKAAPASSTLLWLHGQSRLTQSLFDAMQLANFSPSQLLWSESQNASETPAQLSQIVMPLADVEQKLKDTVAQQSSLANIVVVGEELVGQLPLLSQLNVSDKIQLLLATNQLLTRQQASDAWPTGKTTIFTENEQLIAAEAYDFRRWTGQPADLDLLRDAYDEYADF